MKKLICILISVLTLLSCTLFIHAEEVTTTAPVWETEPPATTTTAPNFIGPPEWDPDWQPGEGTEIDGGSGEVVNPSGWDFTYNRFGVNKDKYPYVIKCLRVGAGDNFRDMYYFSKVPWIVNPNNPNQLITSTPSGVGTVLVAQAASKHSGGVWTYSIVREPAAHNINFLSFYPDGIYKNDCGCTNIEIIFSSANFKVGSYSPDVSGSELIDPTKYDWKGIVGLKIPSVQEYLDKYGISGFFKWMEDLVLNIIACTLTNLQNMWHNIQLLFQMLLDGFKSILDKLFIPSEETIKSYIHVLYAKTEEKIPIITQITDWLGQLVTVFQNSVTATVPPVSQVTLWGHDYEFMNFSAFLPLVEVFRVMIVAFLYFRWIIGLTKRIPAVIGATMDIGGAIK